MSCHDLPVTAFVYDENNKLVREELIRGGKYFDDSIDAQLYRAHVQKEIDFQYEKLQSEGIYFPMPDLVVDEVMDLSRIVDVFRVHHTTAGSLEESENQFVFRLADLNEDVKFRPAGISSVVGTEVVFIKDLEVIVKNSFPSRVNIVTEDGSLSIEFDYAAGNLRKIEYRFTRRGNQTSKLSKKFAYISP